MMAAPGTGLGQHRHVIAYASAYGQLSIDSGVSERSYISQVHENATRGKPPGNGVGPVSVGCV
jgi:hypothetical protein